MRKVILLSASIFFSITVFSQDSKGILISEHPMKMHWPKSELASFPYPEASTDCEDKNIQWIYVDKKFSGGNEGVIERTWMAEDKCGNKSSTVQFILLKD